MDCWSFQRSRPVLGQWQPLAPCFATIVAALVNDGAFAMSFGIDRQDCLAVFEQHSRGMTQILARLLIHNNLPFAISIQVNEWNASKCRGKWLRSSLQQHQDYRR